MTTVTDDFNRADSSTLGSGWENQSGEGGSLALANNVARTNDIFNVRGNRRTGESWGNDQSSQAVVASAATWRSWSVRTRTSGAARTYYAAGVENFEISGASNRYRIWKIVSGTLTSLANHGTQEPAASDVVKLSITGTGLSLRVNGTEILTATDSDIASGTPGIGCQDNVASDAFEDWVGEDSASASGSKKNMLLGVG
jgi:hypothetical protein